MLNVLIEADRNGITEVRRLAMLFLLADAKPDAPASVVDFSMKIRAPKPAITRAVDGLVRRGLANRVEDANDRRKVIVTATDEGRALAERLRNIAS